MVSEKNKAYRLSECMIGLGLHLILSDSHTFFIFIRSNNKLASAITWYGSFTEKRHKIAGMCIKRLELLYFWIPLSRDIILIP